MLAEFVRLADAGLFTVSAGDSVHILSATSIIGAQHATHPTVNALYLKLPLTLAFQA
jgi:hypothetical protein